MFNQFAHKGIEALQLFKTASSHLDKILSAISNVAICQRKLITWTKKVTAILPRFNLTVENASLPLNIHEITIYVSKKNNKEFFGIISLNELIK
ncbi:hypothetical protein BpHYR1_010365 [Brachionus plicatilis]|uniref:Uncharacterized protein n=1 Tax=Brachionus plicatilis TaxID=10195 RepID=A0A3M7RIR1_BRAPC|nr:hypothetical protein BpHYR1_010365 [Brachionus plicatilis]